MKFLDTRGKVVAEANNWAQLVFIAEDVVYVCVPAKAMTIAYWCVADVARMDDFGVDDLLSWTDKSTCPFLSGGEETMYDDWLFKAAGLLWFGGFYGRLKHYTSLGKKRALIKAAQEPVKTPQELVKLYAEDRGLTIVIEHIGTEEGDSDELRL